MHPDGTVNWVYVLITLGIRFVGVFIVLAILWFGLAISAKIIAALAGKSKKPS